MKCVSCGKAEMVRDIRDVTYTHKGQTTIIPNVGGLYCPECGESVHNAEESQYLNAAMLDSKRVDIAIIGHGVDLDILKAEGIEVVKQIDFTVP